MHGVADGRAEEEMNMGRIASTKDLFKKSYGNTLLWNLPNIYTHTHVKRVYMLPYNVVTMPLLETMN